MALDFYRIRERSTKNGVVEVYPDFRVVRSKDLMVRGKSFYAVWDEEAGLWSTDEYDVQRLVDADLNTYKNGMKVRSDGLINVKYMQDFSSGSWADFRRYISNISDNAKQLDESLTFSDTSVKKTDYVSKRLPYPLQKGSIQAWNELIGTLYDPEERAKIEWAVGAVVAGDSKDIQKFLVLYGAQGSGKSTILNVIQMMFAGYYETFEAKALASSNNSFSAEVFKNNPLVAFDHDGDLSRIEDNTKLNTIISHEEMTINEKFKPAYTARINTFLFMGTNKPVRITDAKSGIIRRLIDVRPSGEHILFTRYQTLMSQVEFELGAIAHHCLSEYRSMGKSFYDNYRPLEMMLQTDVFFNYVEAHYHIFSEQDGVSIAQAYELYKTYCDESMIDHKLPRHKFRDELKNYFHTFSDRITIDGKQVRSWYSGFLKEKFLMRVKVEDPVPYALVMDKNESIFDIEYSDFTAQYAKSDPHGNEIPAKRWEDVTTKLGDLDTNKVHYVRVPLNHIVIDFDLRNEKGEKDRELNLKEANKWPPTYAEYSKGGEGIHLHYIYDGDTTHLSRLYSEDIEVKIFTGGSSLRRRLSKCNSVPIATINSGLPLKEKKMINFKAVQSERGLRDLIARNLRKEIHPGTKPSIDFIYTILDEAYSSGLHFDVTDLRPRILAFANNSTNQAAYCVKLVSKMNFKSEEPSEPSENYDSDTLVMFDIEVFPNLFLVSWKFKGEGKEVVRMINPSSQEVEELMRMRLVGFNCRRYDNHILYARFMGYSIYELYQLSQKIINGKPNAMFAEAYSLSYADVYDFSSKKQSLKKWQIELGITHKELGLPWDKPVPDEVIPLVGEYCDNDVISTEAVFDHLHADFMARQILADLSGLKVNDTTQRHTAQIIFGNERNPQDEFVYTDLSEMFPGYSYAFGKSEYRGEDPGEGGYVYAEPGIHKDVALLDVVSMHPNSAILLNVFGPYTHRFKDLVEARVAIKEGNFDLARKMLGGKLEPYLNNEEESEKLAYALKIVINIVYGLTSAKFDNKFKDSRNVDNIVAKRGALFMIDLKHAVQEQGYTVAHIKTDSIKIANATQEIIDFVVEFGKKYGYSFDSEAVYSKMCLTNDAVYIAKEGNEWHAVGAQFAHPYVYKTLFNGSAVVFDDLCETKSVSTALYLNMNEGLPEGENAYHFVGKAGRFTPIKPGRGGGVLLREKEGKYYAATGTKGYRWLESELIQSLGRSADIDYSYFENLVEEATKNIARFGDPEEFLS